MTAQQLKHTTTYHLKALRLAMQASGLTGDVIDELHARSLQLAQNGEGQGAAVDIAVLRTVHDLLTVETDEAA